MDFMDPEVFSDFINEAREHLETIEPNLLELEKSPDNLSLLNEIFRPMHSLKGASGFLGLNAINRLAHKAENIMDELRKGAMPVTTEIMDVILSATDALRMMVENLESSGTEGDVDVNPLVSNIENILAGGAPASTPVAKPEPAPASEAPSVQAVPEPTPTSQPETTSVVAQKPDKDHPQLASYALTSFGETHLSDFLEESYETVDEINSALLTLERDPHVGGDLVNDIFRYFHNLKGNSGIIGFHEINGLTHEAETLLNRVRKGEMQSSHALIDLLLAVADMTEALLGQVNPANGHVTPLDTSFLVKLLHQAVERNAVDPIDEGELKDNIRGATEAHPPVASGQSGGPSSASPEEMLAAAFSDAGMIDTLPETDSAGDEEAPEESDVSDVQAAAVVAGDEPYEVEDVEIFKNTVHQTLDNIQLALDELRKDANQRDFIDGLHRSFVTMQNSCNYMGLDEIKVYAERTAGLVDSARDTDMDFSMMIDILEQEAAILHDMIINEVDSMDAKLHLADEPVQAAPEQAPEPAPQPEPVPEPAPAPEAGQDVVDEIVEVVVEEKQAAPEPRPKAPEPVPAAQEKVEVPPVEAPRPQPAPARTPPPAAPSPASPPQPAMSKPKVSSTIRVDHEKLDHLMNLIGELIINRNRFAMLAKHLEEGEAHDVADIAQNLTETTYAMARISDDLQDTIMKVRMVPVQTVFSRFPRLVRDLSRKSGKEIDLITEGEETELDKSVVEVIGDPLVHLIRNAVDHGVEMGEERTASGKSSKGTVWLRAYHKGNSVAIEIEDDGKGIDPDKMREVAINKGIITPEEAKNLDDREATELIFAPGFSSAKEVTDISGRGVGMDVVRTNIKNLKGSVNIESRVGKGTKFILSLPLTLAIIDALMVTVSGETYAIPLDAVSETTKIEAEKITEVNNRKAVTLRGEVLGIVDLHELLELEGPETEPEILSTVVIQDNQRRLGLVVDRLLERQEIVIKPLGNYLGDQKGISGATIMGDGSVVLILDPHEIYLMATSKAI